MIDLAFSESQELLKKTARDFFSKECPKSFVRQMEQDVTGFSPEMWHKMAELGWLGIIVPEQYGGQGMDFLHLAVLMEEMGRACTPGPFFSTAVVGASTLVEAANEQQKKELLPQLAKGNLIITLALTEPSVTYDVEGVEFEAIGRDGNYALSGTKLFIPDAQIANYLVCVARTKDRANKEDGISLFLVDARSPGISCVPLKTIGGDKQFEVLFDKVTVPGENMLGALNKGWSYMERVLLKATCAKCVEMVGAGQQVLEMTIAYAKERRQFDRPIGSFQAIQHHCANLGTYLDGARLIAYKAAWMISENLPCTKQVAMAKAWCSESYRRICAIGQQIHAGVGFINDHDMPLYFRRAKAWELAFGDADFHREKVAQELGL